MILLISGDGGAIRSTTYASLVVYAGSRQGTWSKPCTRNGRSTDPQYDLQLRLGGFGPWDRQGTEIEKSACRVLWGWGLPSGVYLL